MFADTQIGKDAGDLEGADDAAAEDFGGRKLGRFLAFKKDLT